MSFSRPQGETMDDSTALVNAILRSPRIRQKLVVLCEGDILPIEGGRPRSPQMYGQLERMPDANFYKACIPRDWHGHKLPQFFNCGGRSQVLQTYRAVLKKHAEAPADSYLSPEKLYALVDLDIQAEAMPEDYPWRTTEEVHEALYKDGAIQGDPDPRHRIWVTALVHKEAFLVLPAMERAWANGLTPFFAGAPLELRKLHIAVAQELAQNSDVAEHIDIVRARLARFDAGARLNCQDAAGLSQSWLAACGNQVSGEAYEMLVKALLAVAKVKAQWSNIIPDPRQGSAKDPETFREQLALSIGREVIAELPPGAHPLAGFIAWLKPRR